LFPHDGILQFGFILETLSQWRSRLLQRRGKRFWSHTLSLLIQLF